MWIDLFLARGRTDIQNHTKWSALNVAAMKDTTAKYNLHCVCGKTRLNGDVITAIPTQVMLRDRGKGATRPKYRVNPSVKLKWLCPDCAYTVSMLLSLCNETLPDHKFHVKVSSAPNKHESALCFETRAALTSDVPSGTVPAIGIKLVATHEDLHSDSIGLPLNIYLYSTKEVHQ